MRKVVEVTKGLGGNHSYERMDGARRSASTFVLARLEEMEVTYLVIIAMGEDGARRSVYTA